MTGSLSRVTIRQTPQITPPLTTMNATGSASAGSHATPRRALRPDAVRRPPSPASAMAASSVSSTGPGSGSGLSSGWLSGWLELK